MRYTNFFLWMPALLLITAGAGAAEPVDVPLHAGNHAAEHGGQTFHMFRLEADAGHGKHDPLTTWDFDGWVGGDTHKLWLKSEGEATAGRTESAEFWGLYSRNISDFWDGQVGLRHDTRPEGTTYLVAGLSGLAPYFFETEAHFFVSDEGDFSARLRQENDFLITQRFILQPYLEANLFAQDVPAQDVGAGLADAEIGVKARYEIVRQVAPYIEVHYQRQFGNTARRTRRLGDNTEDVVTTLGLRLMF